VKAVGGMVQTKSGMEERFQRPGSGSTSSLECGGRFGSSVGWSSAKSEGAGKEGGDVNDRRSLKGITVVRCGDGVQPETAPHGGRRGGRDRWAPRPVKKSFKIIQTVSNLISTKTDLPLLQKFETKYGSKVYERRNNIPY
jgi:hypothetical protein